MLLSLTPYTLPTKHVQRDFSHRNFRLRLARALIGDFTCKKQKAIVFKNMKGGNFGVPDEIRLQSVGIHFPELQDTYTMQVLFIQEGNKAVKHEVFTLGRNSVYEAVF